jgi:ankyrin repeat protein
VLDKDTAGWFPIHHAAASGHTECVLKLLDHMEVCRDRQVLLYHPAQRCSTSPVDLSTNHRGETPLHLAARGGHRQTCRELVDRGASTLLYPWATPPPPPTTQQVHPIHFDS